MAKNAKLKTVKVSGSYDRIGREAGKACKQQVRGMIKEAEGIISRLGLDWSKASSRAAKHLPYVAEYNPDFVEFVKGYSAGSGVSLDDLFVLFGLDEKGLCTDVAVNQEATADGGVYSAHTEDWTPKSQEFVTLLRCKPKNGPDIMVVTLGGLEWICGINSSGLSLTGNSLYHNDVRIGIPKLTMAHKILASKSIGDAMAAATPANRASSYCNNICHSSGEMYSVEGSATDFAALYPQQGYLVHTNHYLHPSMLKYESVFGSEGNRCIEQSSSTLVRYHRALRLTRSQLGSITQDTLSSILSDHVGRPGSICRHEEKHLPAHERTKTTFAVIFDLKKLSVRLWMGNPCKGEPVDNALR